jgi:hypothetical protein
MILPVVPFLIRYMSLQGRFNSNASSITRNDILPECFVILENILELAAWDQATIYFDIQQAMLYHNTIDISQCAFPLGLIL